MHRIAAANNIKILTAAPYPPKISIRGLAPSAFCADSAPPTATRAAPGAQEPAQEPI
jgi:hypothetical protein